MLWATAFVAAAAIGLVGRPALGPELVVGLAIGVGLFVALSAELPRLPSRPMSVLAARAAYVVGAAAFEELLWRGVTLALLADAVGVPAAVGLSTALFALSHRRRLGRGSAVHLATGAAFGGMFVWGGLAAAILAHAAYNVLVDLGVQGDLVRRRPS